MKSPLIIQATLSKDQKSIYYVIGTSARNYVQETLEIEDGFVHRFIESVHNKYTKIDQSLKSETGLAGADFFNETKEIGEKVYSSFLPDTVKNELQLGDYDCIHLVLSQELLPIPWELAFRHDASTLTYFLIYRSPIFDNRDNYQNSEKIMPPIKVLLVSNPTGDLDGSVNECRQIFEMLRNNSLFDVRLLSSSFASVSAVEAGFEWADVVHYSGHSDVGEDGSAWLLSDGKLTQKRIANLVSLPQFVFANSCHSGCFSVCSEAKQSGFRGNLLVGEVPNFICTSGPVPDYSAATFSVELYRHLALGKPLHESLSRAIEVSERIQRADEWIRYSYIVYSESNFRLIDHELPPKPEIIAEYVFTDSVNVEGEPICISVCIENTGRIDAENISVEPRIPFDSDLNKNLDIFIERIRPGQKQELVFEGIIDKPGDYSIQDTCIQYNDFSGSVYNISFPGQSITIKKKTPPHLVVERVFPDEIIAGIPFEIEYRITNEGNIPVRNLTLVDNTPKTLREILEINNKLDVMGETTINIRKKVVAETPGIINFPEASIEYEYDGKKLAHISEDTITVKFPMPRVTDFYGEIHQTILDQYKIGIDGEKRIIAITGEQYSGADYLVQESVEDLQKEKILLFSGRWMYGGIEVLRNLIDSGLKDNAILKDMALDSPFTSSGKKDTDSLISLYDLLNNLSELAPIAIVITGILEVDPLLARLVSDLMSIPQLHPLFLLLSFEQKSEAVLKKEFSVLKQQDVLTTIDLSRLDQKTCVEQIKKHINGFPVPEGFAEAVYRKTGGLFELIKEQFIHLDNTGEILYSNSGCSFAVDAVDKLISSGELHQEYLNRYESLSVNAKKLVSICTILKQDHPEKMLLEISGLHEDEALDAIDELISKKIISQTGEKDSFSLSTPIYREIADERITGGRRKNLCSKIAEFIEKYHGDMPDYFRRNQPEYLICAEQYEKAMELLPEIMNTDLNAGNYYAVIEYSKKIDQIKNADSCSIGKLYRTALFTTSDAYHSLGRNEEALGILKNLNRKNSKISNEESAEITRRLGWIYYRQDDIENAEKCFLDARKVFEEIKDRIGTGRCLMSLGNVSRIKKDYDKASDFYLESLKILNSANADNEKAKVLNNLGILKRTVGDYKAAEIYYKQALRIAEDVGNKSEKVKVFNNIGNLLSDIDAKGSSVKFFKQALNLAEEIQDAYAIAVASYNIAEILLESGRQRNACGYLERALFIFSCLKNAQMQQITQELLAKAEV